MIKPAEAIVAIAGDRGQRQSVPENLDAMLLAEIAARGT